MNVKLLHNGSPKLAYLGLHQDYSVLQVTDSSLSEAKACEVIIKRCLTFGHWGVIEHIPVVFSCGSVPHSAVQQLTRHRLLSFDVQSFRYTSQAIIEAAEGTLDIEEVVYLKKPGTHRNPRESGSYTYTETQREADKQLALDLCKLYRHKVVELGIPPEHARGMLPFDYRQHFIVSGNLRAFFHLFDVRIKANVQEECLELVTLMREALKESSLEPLVLWHEKYGKHKLAP